MQPTNWVGLELDQTKLVLYVYSFVQLKFHTTILLFDCWSKLLYYGKIKVFIIYLQVKSTQQNQWMLLHIICLPQFDASEKQDTVRGLQL